MRHRRCEATGELSVHWNQCGARRQARAAKVVTLPPPVTREMPSRPWAPGVKHEGLWQTRESTPRVVGIQRTAHPRSAICSNRKCTGRVAVDESDASRDCPIERGWSRRPGLTRDDHLVPARPSPRRRRASCIRIIGPVPARTTGSAHTAAALSACASAAMVRPREPTNGSVEE